jgi:hypothetical protein
VTAKQEQNRNSAVIARGLERIEPSNLNLEVRYEAVLVGSSDGIVGGIGWSGKGIAARADA